MRLGHDVLHGGQACQFEDGGHEIHEGGGRVQGLARWDVPGVSVNARHANASLGAAHDLSS